MTQMKLITKRDGRAAIKKARAFRHKAKRHRAMIEKPVIKDGSFKGPIRKNQRKTEYF